MDLIYIILFLAFKETLAIAPVGSFSISRKQYIRHQFPNPVVTDDGRKIYKPKAWEDKRVVTSP